MFAMKPELNWVFKIMKHVENFEVGTIEENISYLLIFIKCALKPSLRILASFLVMSKSKKYVIVGGNVSYRHDWHYYSF